jgi:hypothetical protein
MENQAFGRVHRIGQEKETYFVKIVVKDSIDEALLQMQEGKASMIAKALQEEDASQKTVPTIEELMRLFGVGADGGVAASGDEEETVGGVIVLSDDDDDEGEGENEGQGQGQGEGGEREGEDGGGGAAGEDG